MRTFSLYPEDFTDNLNFDEVILEQLGLPYNKGAEEGDDSEKVTEITLYVDMVDVTIGRGKVQKQVNLEHKATGWKVVSEDKAIGG